jgi:hypothetical protein
VWHLPNGTTLTALDSTSNDNDGTITNTAAGAGRIGGSAVFNGTDTSISIPNVISAYPFTISYWLKTNTSTDGIQYGLYNSGFWSAAGFYSNVFLTEYSTIALLATNFLNNDWNYIVIAQAEAGSVVIYVNGASKTTVNGGDNWNTGTASSIGKRVGGSAYYLTASMDEVRLSDISTRSAEWIYDEYYNQKDIVAVASNTGHFWKDLSAETAIGGGATGSISTTIAGTSVLTLGIRGIGKVSAQVAGSGSLQSKINGKLNLSTSISASSSVQSLLRGIGRISSTMDGVGSIASKIRGIGKLSTAIAGLGELLASTNYTPTTAKLYALISGVGRLRATIGPSSAWVKSVANYTQIGSMMNNPGVRYLTKRFQRRVN